ncbi:MAG TPA: hypothetical protein VF746_26990 [Longimicrobium sp.]|jgi:hypothetical protein
MRTTLSIAALAGLLALAACDQASTGADGLLTGTWRYQALGLVQHGLSDDVSCNVEYVFDVTHTDDKLRGITRLNEEHVTCWQEGREPITLPNGPNLLVVDGEVEDGRVHFSIAGNYHSFGEVHPDRIEGHVESYWSRHPSEEILVDTMGTFVLTRVP